MFESVYDKYFMNLYFVEICWQFLRSISLPPFVSGTPVSGTPVASPLTHLYDMEIGNGQEKV